ncbi:MAG: type IV pilus modification protein PilV [Cellvibrionales bacterium]|jgi:type IV pilus assembly protein PilV
MAGYLLMTMHSGQTGFTLIEVLVTLLIIAIGLLGLGALQVNTMNDQFEANQRAYATSLVDDMASRIRANNTDAVAGAYFGTTEVTDCRAVANTTVVRDLCLWNALLAGDHAQTAGGESVGSALDAVGCIEAGPTGSDGNSIRVTVAWQGVKASVPPAASCGANTFGDETFRRAVFRDVFLR